MQTVWNCLPSELCFSQRSTGGEYGVPEQVFCMAGECHRLDVQCLYVKQGGKRPVGDEPTLKVVG